MLEAEYVVMGEVIYMDEQQKEAVISVLAVMIRAVITGCRTEMQLIGAMVLMQICAPWES
jgi:hypothetical protein